MLRLIFLLILVSEPLNPALAPEWVIWNVGQGQWVTRVDLFDCDHFDMGGEVFPERVTELCESKRNRVYFSHWDWDHIAFIKRIRQRFKILCIAAHPAGPSRGRNYLLRGIPDCKKSHAQIRELTPTRIQSKRPNDHSRIFVVDHRMLIPGDSTSSQEKFWSQNLPNTIQVLVAGHHGSKTSTSTTLLRRLPNLSLAVASSRRKKYGHPHHEVVNRLLTQGIPILSTEDWGAIFLRLEK